MCRAIAGKSFIFFCVLTFSVSQGHAYPRLPEYLEAIRKSIDQTDTFEDSILEIKFAEINQSILDAVKHRTSEDFGLDKELRKDLFSALADSARNICEVLEQLGKSHQKSCTLLRMTIIVARNIDLATGADGQIDIVSPKRNNASSVTIQSNRGAAAIDETTFAEIASNARSYAQVNAKIYNPVLVGSSFPSKSQTPQASKNEELTPSTISSQVVVASGGGKVVPEEPESNATVERTENSGANSPENPTAAYTTPTTLFSAPNPSVASTSNSGGGPQISLPTSSLNSSPSSSPMSSVANELPHDRPCRPHAGTPYPDEGSGMCTGNLFLNVPLVTLPFSLVYNSISDNQDFGFGVGWKLSVDRRILHGGTESGATVVDGTGMPIVFRNDGTGNTLVASDRRLSLSRITWGGTPIEHFPDGTKFRYLQVLGGGFAVSSIVDRNENETVFMRDSEGIIVGIVNPYGSRIVISVSGRHANQIQDLAGSVYRLRYDASGNLIALSTPEFGESFFAYHPNSSLLAKTLSPTGLTAEFNYLSNGILRNVVNHLNFVTKYVVTANTVTWNGEAGSVTVEEFESGLLKSVNRSGSRSIVEKRDGLGRIERLSTAAGDVLTYKYKGTDPFVESIHSLASNTESTFDYDADFNLLQVKTTGPNRQPVVSNYSYDKFGQVTFKSINGKERRFERDWKGNLRFVRTESGVPIYSYTYNSDGSIATFSNENGLASQFHYDRGGYLDGVTDPQGRVYSWVNNALGVRVSGIFPDGVNVVTVPNALGELVQTSVSRGAHSVTYDSTILRTPAGKIVNFRTFGDGRETSRGQLNYSADGQLAKTYLDATVKVAGGPALGSQLIGNPVRQPLPHSIPEKTVHTSQTTATVMPKIIFPTTDGPINAMEIVQDELIIGGDFQTVGTFTGSWAPLLKANGETSELKVPDNNFYINDSMQNLGTTTNTIAYYGGNIEVKGYFVGMANGGAMRRFDASGKVVSGDWNREEYAQGSPSRFASATGPIAKGQNGVLFATIWGNGEKCSGAPSFGSVSGIASFDMDSGERLNCYYLPNSEGKVLNLISAADRLFVFTENSNGGRKVFALNSFTLQKISNWNPPDQGSVAAIGTDGRQLFLLKTFNNLSQSQDCTAAMFRKLSFSDGAEIAWPVSASSSGSNSGSESRTFTCSATAFTTVGSKIYVAGQFSETVLNSDGSVRSSTSKRFKTLSIEDGKSEFWLAEDSATSPSPTPRPGTFGVIQDAPIYGGDVTAISSDGENIYVGGRISRYRSGKLGVVAFDLNGGYKWDSSNSGEGSIAGIDIIGNQIIVAGNFPILQGKKRSRLAKINMKNGSLSNWAPIVDHSQVSARVSNLAVQGGTVYVNGTFDKAQSSNSSSGPQARINMAAFGLSNGILSPWSPNIADGSVNPSVQSLAAIKESAGTNVFVAYSFMKNEPSGSKYFYRIKKIDSSGAVSMLVNETPALNSNWKTKIILKAAGERLFAAGYFSGFGGIACNIVVSINTRDGSAGCDLRSGMNPEVKWPYSLSVKNNLLVAVVGSSRALTYVYSSGSNSLERLATTPSFPYQPADAVFKDDYSIVFPGGAKGLESTAYAATMSFETDPIKYYPGQFGNAISPPYESINAIYAYRRGILYVGRKSSWADGRFGYLAAVSTEGYAILP